MNWIKQELAQRGTLINQALENYLQTEEIYPPVIHQAMRYSVFAGGKRLRPILVLAAAEVVSNRPHRALPAAVALEFIHTYSLIHDDLPAMDNDDLRRGRPTCHKVYGEAVAILAGDALLTQAFEVLSDTAFPDGPESTIVLQVIREIAQAAGTLGMIGGQVVDLASEGQQIDLPTLTYIHQHKTGALIRAAVRSGALLGGASADELLALTGYAEAFGLAFQIADDILDVVGNEAVLGKPVGSDARNEKSTFPNLFGLERSQEMARETAEKAITCLARFGDRARFLRALTQYVLERDS
ncbi:MAG: polyprenyl synthetase family protein [Syntrophomonadaceae bacterium]|nr:polyprenyl synthetase family protein [Syntrophomonadaceae bacterium]